MNAIDVLFSGMMLVALLWSRIQSAEDYCALAHKGKHIPTQLSIKDCGSVSAAIDAMHGSLYCQECGTIIKRGNPFWSIAKDAMPGSLWKQFRDGKHWSNR